MPPECAANYQAQSSNEFNFQGHSDVHLGSGTWYNDSQNYPQNMQPQEHFTNSTLADSSTGSTAESGTISNSGPIGTGFAPHAGYDDTGSVHYAQDGNFHSGSNDMYTSPIVAPNALVNPEDGEYVGSSMDRSEPQGDDVSNCNGIADTEDLGLDTTSTETQQCDVEPVPMMASSSFADLPHEPSPFDQFGSQQQSTPDTTESSVPQETTPANLGPPENTADSSAHSRTSSFGNPAGVKFIVGGSGPPSSNNSPYPPFGGASPRDSPICDANSVTTTSNACSLVSSSVVTHTTPG